MFNGELIFHKKDTEKVVLFFITSERLDVKIRDKNLCAHLYYAPNILLCDTKCCARKQSCSNTLEEMNSKIYFPERWKINWHILKTAKAYLRYPQGLCFFIVRTKAPKSSFSKALHTKNFAQDFTILSALEELD